MCTDHIKVPGGTDVGHACFRGSAKKSNVLYLFKPVQSDILFDCLGVRGAKKFIN